MAAAGFSSLGPFASPVAFPGARGPLYYAEYNKALWEAAGIAVYASIAACSLSAPDLIAGGCSGDLTPTGVAQSQSFGAYLRQKYVVEAGILPARYKDSQLRVRSSDVDRTLQTVTAMLRGLYPQDTVPVHTIDLEVELLLQPPDKCACKMPTSSQFLAFLLN